MLLDPHAAGPFQPCPGLRAPVEQDHTVRSRVDLLEIQTEARAKHLGAEIEPRVQQEVADVPRVERRSAGSEIPGLDDVGHGGCPDEPADLAPALSPAPWTQGVV